MNTKITSVCAAMLILASLSACESNLETDIDIDELAVARAPEPVIALLAGDCELSRPDCVVALNMVENAIAAEDLDSGTSEPVWLAGSCAGPTLATCSALSLFDGSTAATSHLWSLDDHPGANNYVNMPPNNQAKQWVMGDWNGDGLDSPGYYVTNTGSFRYTNIPAAASGSWSSPISISDGYELVVGRFLAEYDNDCVGMIIDVGNNGPGDTMYQLEYWCDLSASPAAGSHGSQWIGAILPDSSFPAGMHQFVGGDWDGDGIDEIASRKDRFISYSLIDPASGPAAFAQAQRWGVPVGEVPETGEFVSGDWNGDGIDGWGVLYDDNHFFYRNDLSWNPGADAYYMQHIDNLFPSRDVSSHQLDLP